MKIIGTSEMLSLDSHISIEVPSSPQTQIHFKFSELCPHLLITMPLKTYIHPFIQCFLNRDKWHYNIFLWESQFGIKRRQIICWRNKYWNTICCHQATFFVYLKHSIIWGKYSCELFCPRLLLDWQSDPVLPEANR